MIRNPDTIYKYFNDRAKEERDLYEFLAWHILGEDEGDRKTETLKSWEDFFSYNADWLQSPSNYTTSYEILKIKETNGRLKYGKKINIA